MHRLFAAVLASLGALALASPALAASDKAAALKRELGPSVKVAGHAETGQVRFVGAAPGHAIPSGAAPGASAREAARSFLSAHGAAFGVRDQARDLRVEASKTFRGGRSSVRFQQLLDGVPVLGGELVVNLDADRDVLAASGELLPGSVARLPRVTADAARAEALAAVAKARKVSKARLTGSAPSLAVYDARLLGGPGPQGATLAWRLDVTGDSGLAIDDLVLIDAQRGNVAVRIQQIEEAKNRSVCDSNSTAAQLNCTAPVRVEGGPASGVADVNFAYDYAGDTYDFFFNRLGRDSLDGAGLSLKSTVRYCPSPTQCPFQNAFWNGQQMVYGAGFAAADDVVGHELTHGVTDFSAHLFYYFQSGAINESLSDVFGEFIDQTNGEGTDTPDVKWRLGEDIPGIGAGRDMEDPTTQGHPDRMASDLYFADPNFLDNGGVHINSGVNNKAAFLMTDGGTHNGRTVSALGIPKVAQIYYDVQTQFLTSGSDYKDLGSALGQACDDLVGTTPSGAASAISAADCTEVRDAVAATEMGVDPPKAPAPEAPAAACPSGQVRTDLFRDDMEDPNAGNWSGPTSVWGFITDYAHSGVASLYGFNPGTITDASATMTGDVAIPAGATSAYLRFDHAYDFEFDSSFRYDGGVVEVSQNGGPFQDVADLGVDVGYNGTLRGAPSNNPLAGRDAFVARSNGYRATRVNLGSLKGDDVRFRFRIGADGAVSATGWIIDDVHIYSCGAPTVPPDGDGDGVQDAIDLCPFVAGLAPSGCPPTNEGPSGGGGGTTGGGGPATTGGTATLASAKLRSCKRSGKGKKTRVRCTLRDFGAVSRATVTVKRKGKIVAKKTLKPSARGVLAIKPKRKLRKGIYKVTIVLRDASGDKVTLKKSFKVK